MISQEISLCEDNERKDLTESSQTYNESVDTSPSIDIESNMDCGQRVKMGCVDSISSEELPGDLGKKECYKGADELDRVKQND